MTKPKLFAVVVSALVLAAAGCADRIAAPENADAEKSLLVKRVRDLKVQVTAEGSLTPALSKRLESLKQDVTAWQARTGRTDFGFKVSQHVSPEPTSTSVSAQIRGTPSSPCGYCPPVTVAGDIICFLEAKPDCTSGTRGSLCKYVCWINIG